MKRLSIRARLTLWYTGILATTLILLGGASYGLLMRGLWQDVDATLEGVAKTVVQAANRPPAELIPPDLDEVLRRLFGPRFTDKFYQFLDPDGRLDPRWPRFGGEPLHVSPKALKNAAEGFATFETRPGNGRFPVRVLTFPVVQHGRMVNVLQVGMSLEGVAKTVVQAAIGVQELIELIREPGSEESAQHLIQVRGDQFRGRPIRRLDDCLSDPLQGRIHILP